jgi:D-glucuronyl C5-epimerase C-terminus
MGYAPRTLAAAGLAAALLSAPAHAGEVIVVDGERAVRQHDPAVPSRADIRLGRQSWARAAAAAARPRDRRVRGDRRAVYSSLRGTLRRGRIGVADYRRWRRWYVLALRTYRRLRGARRDQLGYVIDSVEGLALRRLLGASRMPVAFLQLERNRQYWRALPYPAAGDQVSFRGSQILFQYFPGYGLQLHPLSTFKKANHLHGFCERGEPACDPVALQTLLDEMTPLAVQRGRRFIAWEYLFHFGGGTPPWMSGMAQATGIQALARAAALLGRPDYVETARQALGAFEAPPPRGVRTTGPRGGVHYLQYSFAPRLYIFNAFLQALIGLHDFSRLTADPRAAGLYTAAEPEARAEVPLSDVGDWSRYSYAGAESTADYHELLRELLQSMCSRRLGPLYCDYAERFRSYQVDPPELTFDGPSLVPAKEPTAIRFTVSKLSHVELHIFKEGRVVHHALVSSFRRGPGVIGWRPRSPGLYRVRLAAKELRTGLGKKDRVEAEIEVEPATG